MHDMQCMHPADEQPHRRRWRAPRRREHGHHRPITGVFMQKIKQVTGSNTPDPQALGRREFLANTAVIAASLAIVSSCPSSERPREIANNSNSGSMVEGTKLLAGRTGVAFQGRANQHRGCERNQEEQVVPDWKVPPEHVMHRQKQDHHDRSDYFRSNCVARYCCANEARAQRRH